MNYLAENYPDFVSQKEQLGEKLVELTTPTYLPFEVLYQEKENVFYLSIANNTFYSKLFNRQFAIKIGINTSTFVYNDLQDDFSLSNSIDISLAIVNIQHPIQKTLPVNSNFPKLANKKIEFYSLENYYQQLIEVINTYLHRISLTVDNTTMATLISSHLNSSNNVDNGSVYRNIIDIVKEELHFVDTYNQFSLNFKNVVSQELLYNQENILVELLSVDEKVITSFSINVTDQNIQRIYNYDIGMEDKNLVNKVAIHKIYKKYTSAIESILANHFPSSKNHIVRYSNGNFIWTYFMTRKYRTRIKIEVIFAPTDITENSFSCNSVTITHSHIVKNNQSELLKLNKIDFDADISLTTEKELVVNNEFIEAVINETK